jgi:hypothetical protein
MNSTVTKTRLARKRPVNRIFKIGGVRGIMFGAPS